ncbi:serine threonine- kinase Chk2-like [Paramuricea clavata]|uniref:Serine threonine- kinase Chk2-like n=1 Tax=Paramuricea clavata TaxID=317549 RepID=A0A6S7GUE1_PARCT|nr:serine threonine- kinase Chk2-like [Paramuricea clavata]
MSLFGGFTPRDKAVEYARSSTAFEDVNLPSFLFKELVNKDEIGHGGFSSVFTAELPRTVKKFLGNYQIDAKILIKEAKLLNSLQHPNIVAFKDVASGVQYLHAEGIAHRDLKPANVLVSNQHYCWMTDQNNVEKASLISPLVCKLTDFGESRSWEVQTNTILTSKTNRIVRGTPVFMAPEVLLENLSAGKASVPFMQKADIWAFEMIVFCIINPGLKHPYELNMQIEANIKSAVACLEKMVECHTKPKLQEKYSVK